MGIRKGLYNVQEFPFPRKLMNTALSPELVPITQAVDLLNFVPSSSKAGSGDKRYGTTALSVAITGETVQKGMRYTKSDGTIQLLAYTESGKIYYSNDDGASWTSAITGLNTSGVCRWCDFNEKLIIVNGFDANMIWDGTSITTMEEYVWERLFPEVTDENTITIEGLSDLTSKYTAGTEIKIEFSGKDLAITTLTQTSGTATATTTANHNLQTGDIVTVSNATPAGYNGDVVITSTGANTFTYSVDSGLSSPASFQTDYIQCVKGTTKSIGGYTSDNNDLVVGTKSFDTPDKTTGFRFYIDFGRNTDIQGDKQNILYKIQYKLKTDSVWKTKENGTYITQIPKQFEFNGLPSGAYNVRLLTEGVDGIFSPADARIYNVEVELPTGVEIASNGTPNSDNAINISGITRSAGTATVTTTTSHGFATNDAVTIYDAEQEEYNGTFLVTVATATTFTYAVGGDPATPATVDTSLPSTIVYSFDKLVNETTVDTSSYSDPTTTVNLVDNILPNSSDVTIDRLWYKDSPPAFSFIFAENNRLWGLEGGELKPYAFKTTGRLKVYHTDSTNNENTWFNEETQAVSYIDITNKHGVEDELVGISSLDGNMVFHGRNRLQVWGGFTPTLGGDFSHIKTIPVGTVSGDLILPYPSDVVMATKYGLRSLRNVFQSDSLEISADLGSDIDPSIQNAVDGLTTTAKYKAVRSFRYDRDGMYGFLINGEMYVFFITEEARGWVRFDGAFASATDFIPLPDGRLLLTAGDKFYTYDNGAKGITKTWTDSGVAIQIKWRSPWMEKARRWANKKWNLIMGVDTKPTNIVIRRYKDGDIANERVVSVTAGNNLSKWDESLWDTALWDTGSERPTKRDKFIAESFSFAITENDTAGAVNIISIQAIGN